MPHNSSIDIPHVAVTDHYIRRRPADDTLRKKITAFLGLKCYNNSAPPAKTIARGYLEFYERYAPSAPLLDSALRYLGVNNGLDEDPEYIRLWYLQQKFSDIVERAARLKPETMNDAWTAYRIGEAYYQQQQPDSALPWYRRATALKKYGLDFQNKYGICLLALNRLPEALQVFNFVVSENPAHVSANTNLGYIYMQEGRDAMAYDYMMRANQLDPDYEQNLLNLAVWYHNNQQPARARSSILHLLKKHPQNDRARAMLADLER